MASTLGGNHVDAFGLMKRVTTQDALADLRRILMGKHEEIQDRKAVLAEETEDRLLEGERDFSHVL
jgi:hypothetical protein